MYYGTCIPAEYAIYTNVPARQITLLAGFPESNISLTIDRACCSSMTGMRLGYRAIKSGDAEVVIASGAENMGNVPLIADASKARGGTAWDPSFWKTSFSNSAMAARALRPWPPTRATSLLEYGVTREMQDEWAVASHQKYFQAFAAGKYKIGEELMLLEIPQRGKAPLVMDRTNRPGKT